MYTPTSTLSHINSYILLLPRQQRQKFPVESETPGAALEAELPSNADVPNIPRDGLERAKPPSRSSAGEKTLELHSTD